MKLLVNARVRSFNYRVCRLGMIASVMLVLLFLVLTALLGALPTAAGDDMTASATKQNVRLCPACFSERIF